MCIRDRKYTIHYYQREYQWQTKQIEELIDDFGSNTILGFPDKNLLETFHFDNKS